MKKIVFISLSLLSIFLSTSNAIAAPIEIKFSHVVSENTPKGLMAIKLKKLVEQRLDGLVTVKVYPDSQLYNDNEVFEALLRGDVQMAAPSVSKLHTINNKLKIFDLFFLFKNVDALSRFEKSPEAKEILKSLEDRQLVGLGYIHSGMKQISSNRAIRIPADIAGLKFRIERSDMYRMQFETLGSTPVRAPFSKVFTLLHTGMVDAQENTWSNIYTQNIHKVQNYILESNHTALSYLLLTSVDFWYGLPPNIRTELGKIINEAIDYGNRMSTVISNIDRDIIEKEDDIKIIRMSDVEREAWINAVKPTWIHFQREISPELFQAAKEANEPNFQAQ